MAKTKSKFVCQSCGYSSLKWLGKCPGCNEWDTFVEELEAPKTAHKNESKTISTSSKPQKLSDVTFENEDRTKTNISELDRVLGGGIVKGSLVLVGGDPGIGKSTLLLQVADLIAKQNKTVLYVSGEESIKQTKLRADRLKAGSDNLLIVAENNLDRILAHIDQVKPDLLITDSIQTVYHPEVTSAPGSVSQVREATGILMRVAKGMGIATFIVGHVTKSGSIAGPKVLEHMVDTVLYFEGEKHNVYRILRAVKNRFGSTNEIGIFEMSNRGLMEVQNPSNLFLSNRPEEAPGSVVIAAMEGSRPVLIELQALVSQSSFGNPRRMANGVDYNRVIMLMAVLEKRVGMMISDQDGYVNVVGGMSLDEPAADLAIITAIASSFRNKSVDPSTMIFGEVGLTGEIRSVSHAQNRLIESSKMGFKKCVLPKGNIDGLEIPEGVKVFGIESVEEAFSILFGR